MPPKPLPRPTAPPQPMPPKAPVATEAEAPTITACALGRTADGKHAAAVLRIRGREVVECRLVRGATTKCLLAEEAWEDTAYRILYRGEVVPTVEGTLVSGVALALARQPSTKTAAIRLVLEDGRVELPDFAKPAPLPDDGGPRLIFVGGKLDAWHELDRDAATHLLKESLAERRRMARGA